MKRKRVLAGSLALVLALGLAACGGKDTGEGQKTEDTATELNGTWENATGDVMQLDLDAGSYTLMCFGGRVGTAPVEETETGTQLSFGGNSYALRLEGDSLLVEQSGAVTGEVLEGPFKKAETAEIIAYTVSDLEGTWSNKAGETLTVTAADNTFQYQSSSGSGSGTLVDGGDGKGLAFVINGGNAYLIMGKDLSSFTLQPFDGMVGFLGTFTKSAAAEE